MSAPNGAVPSEVTRDVLAHRVVLKRGARDGRARRRIQTVKAPVEPLPEDLVHVLEGSDRVVGVHQHLPEARAVAPGVAVGALEVAGGGEAGDRLVRAGHRSRSPVAGIPGERPARRAGRAARRPRGCRIARATSMPASAL